MAGLGGYALIVNCRHSSAAMATTEAAVAPATTPVTPAAPAVATATMTPATAAVIAASWFERRTEPWRRQKSRKERRKDRTHGDRNW
jgi:hypothetical protein